MVESMLTNGSEVWSINLELKKTLSDYLRSARISKLERRTNEEARNFWTSNHNKPCREKRDENVWPCLENAR